VNKQEFFKHLELEFPSDTALSGDPVGVHIDTSKDVINTVLCAYEITDEVVTEAIKLNADFIVTFHPLIFSSLKTLHYRSRVERCAMNLIKNDIGVYCIHTNLDTHPRGTNFSLAQQLGLQNLRHIIEPSKEAKIGFGCLGEIEPTSLISVVKTVSTLLEAPVRYCGDDNQIISTVAIVAGSGTSFLEQVVAQHVDCFITADVKYHTFHGSQTGSLKPTALIDPGHAEMERFVVPVLHSIISERFTSKEYPLMVFASKVSTNPVKYYHWVGTS
jgi:GTP cyclohydrolase I